MSEAISLSYGDSYSVTSVIRKVTLNYASLGANSNKFYIAELQEGFGGGNYRIYTEYGRMGKNPRKEGRYYNGLHEAENAYYDLIQSKKKKGYEEVEIAETAEQAFVKSKEKVDLSTINDKVLKFIGKIYQSTTNFIVSSINTPLGNLSVRQVQRGLRVLAEIEEELDRKNTGYIYERLSDEFYSIIPVDFGSKVNKSEFIIDNYYKLNEKKDLLGVMSSAINVQKDLEGTLEEQYKALNIKLKTLSKRTKEYKRIVEKLESTKGHNHHYNVKVKEIYEIENMTGFDEFNPYKVSTMELFHGSRNQNILGILQDGLRIKPKSAIHTGSMFGQGIYFADCSSKSANYSFGYGSSDSFDEHFMFLCEVATGKIKEYDSAEPSLYKAPYGYNSVMGKKGHSLIHNEYIVYNENQVKLKYIIEFSEI